MNKKLLNKNILLIFAFIVIIQIFCCNVAKASTYLEIQNRYVTMNMQNQMIKNLLKEIQKQTDLNIVYNEKEASLNSLKSIDVKNESVEKVLNLIFDGTNLRYEIKNEIITIVKRANAVSQQVSKQFQVEGKVIDKESKKPIAGASVFVIGTPKGAITTNDGQFLIEKVDENSEIEVSYVGMRTIKMKVTALNSKNMVISLEADAMAVDEVIVVGYGTTTKKDLTGSVARFDTKVIEESTATNLAQMMQGQVSGLSILTGSGAPGSKSRLEIRGVPSLSGATTPLVVVDGVPMAMGYDINELNPDDVKSVDVLKGASSAAIYGSRAAAGVIMITTKFGMRNQKPEINYSYDYGITSLVSPVRTLTADEYKMLMVEAVANTGLANGYEDITQYSVYKDITKPGYFGEANTQWMNLLMQNGAKQQHSLSVRGGGENVGYTGSFGYVDEKGQVKAASFKRYTYDLGFNADINKFIKASVKFSGVTSNQMENGASLDAAASMRPDIKAYNDDGSLYLHSYYYGTSLSWMKNPIIEMTENTINNKENNIRLSGNLDIQILPELNFFTQYTYQYRDGLASRYWSSNTQEGSDNFGGGKGKAQQTVKYNTTSEFEARFNYKKQFGKHNVNVMAAMTYNDDSFMTNSLTMKDFADNSVQTGVWQGANFGKVEGDALGSILLSYLARGEYKYDNKYLFTATVRLDGSSRFSPKYRWGTFPSFAGAWILSEEKFMSGASSWLPFLKVRVGWGKAGNGYVGEYGWRTLYTTKDYQGRPAIVPDQLGNDELRWEATDQIDAGIDFGFLKDQRITGTIGYYDKQTSGLLYPLTLAPSTGLYTTNINFADIQNKGIEFEMNADIVKSKKFTLSAGFNIAKNMNKITGLDAKYVSNPGSQYLGRTIIKEGESLGLIYGYKTDGIFQSWDEVNRYEALNPDYKYQEQYSYRFTTPGDLKYVDLNGDGRVNKATTAGEHEDRTVLGCSRPDFEGGFNVRMGWKGFIFSLQGTFSSGADKIWDGYTNSFNLTTTGNALDIALKRWTPTNRQNEYPSIKYNTFVNDFCDYSVYNASYVKIQNINLEYSLPQNILDKTKIFGRVSIFASASNPFMFTSYPGPSPEAFSSDTIAGASSDSGKYPTTWTFNFGIKVTIK